MKSPSRRPRGGPKKRFMNGVEEDIRIVGTGQREMEAEEPSPGLHLMSRIFMCCTSSWAAPAQSVEAEGARFKPQSGARGRCSGALTRSEHCPGALSKAPNPQILTFLSIHPPICVSSP